MFDTDLKPIDQVAQRVTSKGIHFKFEYKQNQFLWDIPPETIHFTGKREHNITGKRQGRLVVIGYLGHPPHRSKNARKGKRGDWLVRCDCGLYEIRKRKAINNPNNKWDRCKECRELSNLKRHDEYNRNGKNKHDNLKD